MNYIYLLNLKIPLFMIYNKIFTLMKSLVTIVFSSRKI